MGDMIVHGIKVAFWISIALVFMTAITTFLNLLVSVAFSNVVGEVLAVASMCLPFDASIVFGSVATAVSAILAFLVAQKIYQYASGGSNPLTS